MGEGFSGGAPDPDRDFLLAGGGRVILSASLAVRLGSAISGEPSPYLSTLWVAAGSGRSPNSSASAGKIWRRSRHSAPG